jgi:hypothetical protein
MFKGGGSGQYGIAETRLTKDEFLMKDITSGDRFAFPLVAKPAKITAMPRLSAMLRSREAALVSNPAREGKVALLPVVYAGTFGYSMNAKGDILYSISPASDTHLCRFLGFARPNNDPEAVPTWEPKRSNFDPSRVDKEFSTLFFTTDNDETPGLDVRWGYWRYKFGPSKNENGEDVMGVELLPKNAGAALKAQYEMLRLAGIIGRDPVTKVPTTLVDIPGNLENYLPAVERILLDKLGEMEFSLAFETYEAKDGGSRIRINSLSKQPGAVAKPKKSTTAEAKAKPKAKAKPPTKATKKVSKPKPKKPYIEDDEDLPF